MITVLVEPAALSGAELELAGETHHHLLRVRRLAVGARLRLVDGLGAARWGTLERADRRTATVRLGDAAPPLAAARHVELLVAPPRPERASWLVEKATELGVAAVRFVATDRDPRAIGAGSLERLHRVARAALEQCGGARLPLLSGVHPFDELPALLAGIPRRLALDPGAGPFPEATDAATALLIGPEGGWSEAERRALGVHGCVAVSLGDRVLRVETAALAGAALALLPAAPAR